MNIDKVISTVKKYAEESVWHTFEGIYIDKIDKGKTFYFRTERTIHRNYVIKAEATEKSIEIYLAKEDFYEKYDYGFYYFEYETTLPLD